MSRDVTPATQTGSQSSLSLEQVPGFRPLAVDYVSHHDRLASFFAGDPSSPEAWAQAIERVQRHARDRAGVCAVLDAQLCAREASAPAIDAVRRLAAPDAVAVVTGQQAGLFGGPLYTLYKAMTALQTAEAVSRQHDVPCVALFWVDAEDHDWDEIRRCTVLDGDLRPHTIELPAAADQAPAGTRRLDATIDEAIASMEAALGPTEFTAALLESLGRAYRPGATMAEAFSRWLDSLLGSRGLIVFDASDPAAKPFVADLFGQALEAPGETTRLAADAGSALARLGYDAQVTPQPDSVALFRLDDGREAIKVRDGQLAWGESTATPEALAGEARRHPERFSPNVLLRPLVQDSLFPTVAYVAGPSELAYIGQLRPVYEYFDVPMPLIQPRATATLLDSAAERFLRRYDVAFASLQPQDEQALNALLESLLPPSVETSFDDAAAGIRDRLEAVIEAVGSVDPTLEGAATSTLGRMEKDLRTLHNKVVQAAKRRDETLRRQFTRTRALCFPEGHLQERGIGIVSLLNRYGPALIDRLEADLPAATGRHGLLTI